MMNADEIAKALKQCAQGENCLYPAVCPFACEDDGCMRDMMMEAADLIESLQAQLNGSQNKLHNLIESIKVKGGTEHYPTEDAYLTVCAALEQTKAQLAASQRRERAAVEDIKRVPQVWPCYACKHTGQMSDRCHYDDRDCFEWRGREAGNQKGADYENR